MTKNWPQTRSKYLQVRRSHAVGSFFVTPTRGRVFSDQMMQQYVSTPCRFSLFFFFCLACAVAQGCPRGRGGSGRGSEAVHGRRRPEPRGPAVLPALVEAGFGNLPPASGEPASCLVIESRKKKMKLVETIECLVHTSLRLRRVSSKCGELRLGLSPFCFETPLRGTPPIVCSSLPS